MANITSFTPGDIVVSISGDGAPGDTTKYADNQASPITLEEINPTTGAIDGTLVLPQTTIGANSAVSGEYGSASEGSLELSADGKSLTIAGYGINAQTFNSAETGTSNTYGNSALAQTTSLSSAGNAVPRVVADINSAGIVDSSTVVYNIYNTNNPRSVATVDGSSFYLSGQGVKGDTTQGVFVVADGATTTTPTAINTATDTRTAEISNGTLYVSADTKQGPTATIEKYSGLPTAAQTPTDLQGVNGSVVLAAGQGNSVNSSSVGTAVNLSPENFFFANADTLYVADGGIPKSGGVGDGGLQKYSFNGSKWVLDYTLSAGLNQVANTAAAGTTGLIGLTGSVSGDTVSLYATNATINDLDPTALYKVTDSLSATTLPATESFTQLAAAPNTDSNIRGVAFAPQATAVCFGTGTRIKTLRGDIAVEALEVGDLAITASGACRPIVWIGRRDLDCTALDAPQGSWPVRILAGAFGTDLPERDLWLSPGHPVLVGSGSNEHLVPIMCLVDGTSIAYVPVETVTYWHVELDSHDILLAEGLPAESFLDFGNRPWFGADAEAHALTNPDFVVPGLGARCRPVATDGPLVEAERRRLAVRFEAGLSAQCAWPRSDGLDAWAAEQPVGRR